MLAAMVALTNLCGTVGIDTHGARVVSYSPAGGEEVFFVSETGTGGMPLCWPWFAGLGPCADSRRHGIARYRDFRTVSLVNRSPMDSELTLRLDSDEDTRREFPHDFSLTVTIRLTDRLAAAMTCTNAGGEPFAVTEAFHPYFAVADQARCHVEGETEAEYFLVDEISGRRLSFTDKGGTGRYVWRAKPGNHNAKTVSSLAPDDWRRFVCVENGTLEKARAYTLKPGESHTLVRTIRACAR